jgi:putative CocE/NonD family hydrolase
MPTLRRLPGWILAASLCAAAASEAQGSPAQSEPVAGAPAPFEVHLRKDVMVAMRDGTHLATDIYFPARAGAPADGKFPVILTRTPYSKSLAADLVARTFVPYGYILVMQDVRGRYKSEGHWFPIRDDPNDGFDTAQWIGEQPWSNQVIGTIGTSYSGATQHALAIADAPYVKAMIPRCAMSDFGLYGVRHHGAFELRWLNWVVTLGNAADTPYAHAAAVRAAEDPSDIPALEDSEEIVQQYARNLPLRHGTTPLQFAPDYEKWIIEAMGHGAYDSFWKDSGSSVVDHLKEYKDIPVYHVTGWYDSWGIQVANMNFVALTKAKKSLQRLIVGPWIHSQERLSYAGEAQFTPDASLDLGSFQRRWFDHWLKGIDNGVDREPPVRIYVMGGGDAHKTPEGRLFVGGHWRDESGWPLARTSYTPYFLHRGGILSVDKPTDDEPTTFHFDPRHPVPTLGGNVSSQGKLMFQGAADQRDRTNFWLTSDTKPLSDRKDILVYKTPALESDVEVTGPLIVKLWASSDCRDTDFTVKLVDVYPPSSDYPAGVDLNVEDGIVRARYRDNLDHEEFLEAGKPYEFTIEMYPTSLVFRRGHRIRLDVSSSNFPRFDVNPNTAEPLNDNRGWRTAENTVYTDAGHPSELILPVIPN